MKLLDLAPIEVGRALDFLRHVVRSPVRELNGLTYLQVVAGRFRCVSCAAQLTRGQVRQRVRVCRHCRAARVPISLAAFLAADVALPYELAAEGGAQNYASARLDRERWCGPELRRTP